MVEEHKPVTQFRAMRAANGGWTIHEGWSHDGMLPTVYAYSSDRDMIAAFPGLIGYEPKDAMDEIHRAIQSSKERKRSRNSVPVVSGDFDWSLMPDTLKENLLANGETTITDGVRLKVGYDQD